MQQEEDWQNNPHRYLITMKSGHKHVTDFFDTFIDFEKWLHSGTAGIVTATEHIRIFPNEVELVQPIEGEDERN